MKLHENVAECNDKIINRLSIVEIDNTNNITKNIPKTPIISLFDSVGMKQRDALSLGNVLVLGHNPEWNEQLALLIVQSFKDYFSPLKLKIITPDKFLALNRESRGSNIHIIVCNDAYICSLSLKKLMKLTMTRFLFKLPDIDWSVMRSEPVLKERGREILNILGIDEWKDAIEVGLLASLGSKELCIESGGQLKRRQLGDIYFD